MLDSLKSLNLSKKLAISSVLLFSIGFFPLVYFAAKSLERNLTTLLIDQQQAVVRFAARDLEQKILLRTEALNDIAVHFPIEKLRDRAAIDRYLQERIAIYRLFSNGVVVIDKRGKGIADWPRLNQRAEADYSHLPYFKEVMATGRGAIGKPDIGRFTQKPGVAMAAPIKNRKGEVVGMLAGFISLTDKGVFDLEHAKIGRTGELILVSIADGIVIADTDDDHSMQTLEQLDNKLLSQALADTEQSLIGTDLHGTVSLVSDVRMLAGRWALLGTLPVSEAFAPVQQLRWQIYGIAAALLVLTGALMGYFVHLQLGPLTSATRLLRKIVAGERPLLPLKISRYDEIGEMLVTFNALHKQLGERDLALQTSQQRFQNLFKHMTSGFALHQMVFDEQGEPQDYRYLEVNPAFERLTGLSSASLIGKTVKEVMPDTEGHWIEAFGRVVLSGHPATFENFAKTLNRWYKVVAYSPQPGQFAVIVEDVTQQKAVQQELQHMAHHDVLTGLPNRALFADRLQMAMAQARRRQISLAIGYLDLDRFKSVNDTHGHEIGDLLLIEVAKRLRGMLRADDSISRFGGDEFALLLSDVSDITRLDELLTRLLERIAEPYLLNTVTLTLSMSLGITLFPEDDADPDTLLRHADEALYTAKTAGRNTYRQYTPASAR